MRAQNAQEAWTAWKVSKIDVEEGSSTFEQKKNVTMQKLQMTYDVCQK